MVMDVEEVNDFLIIVLMEDEEEFKRGEVDGEVNK